MAAERFAYPDLLDAGMEAMKAALEGAGGRMVVCEGKPASFAEADDNKGAGGKALATTASVTLTVAANSPDGRKVTISAVNDVDIDVTGSPSHLALIDTSTSRLWCVTPASSVTDLGAGGKVNFPAWDFIIRDPVAPA